MPDEPATSKPSNEKKLGVMTLVKAVAVLALLVLLQAVGVSMLLPSAAETEELAQKLVTAESAEDVETEAPSEDSAAKSTLGNTEMVEVPINEEGFHIVTYDATTGSSLNIDFDLYGTVLAREQSEYEQLYLLTANRLQEQINITVRGSDVTDLSDPDLDLLKRKLLEKTNRTLGKPLVHEIIFSKFSFIER